MTTPVLALWGGRGPSAGAPVLDSWRQVATDVRGQQIEDAAHYVHEEQPEAVAGHILAFAGELRL
jgi:pimeloyl-ACP methyl ester carboxylesterase